jgi:MobA/MobL family
MGIDSSSRDDYLACRARWAELTNEALQHAGLSQRIDHRSLKDRGLDREPTLAIPEKLWYAESKFRRATRPPVTHAKTRSYVRALVQTLRDPVHGSRVLNARGLS